MDQYSGQPNNQYPYGNQPNAMQPYAGYGTSNQQGYAGASDYQPYGATPNYAQAQYAPAGAPLLSTPTGIYQLGGFWMRVAAALLDSLVLVPVAFILGLIFRDSGNLVNYVAGAAYSIAFISYKGATLGKMALGLKVIRSDGTQPTFLTALGRYFAALLFEVVAVVFMFVGIIFGISAALLSVGSRLSTYGRYDNPISTTGWVIFFGSFAVAFVVLFLDYLWVIWDPRKQALHDKLARTFVVKTR